MLLLLFVNGDAVANGGIMDNNNNNADNNDNNTNTNNATKQRQ